MTTLMRTALAAVTSIAAVGLAGPAAAAVTPFSARYSTNAAGDITIVGNTVLTCPASASCTSAQGGAEAVNNDFTMTRVDIDSDAGTFDSSSATLGLNGGDQVLFAGLYWGGRSSAGGSGAAAPAAGSRASVRLKVPGAGGYATITGAETGSISDANNGDAYQAFADVTSQVQAAGAGVYTVADVQVGTGSNAYGGWTLVVVYRDDTAPPRNMTVFDGYEVVRQSPSSDRTKSITVSGMQAPPAGAVTARVGVVAYDGDRGSGIYSGDVLKLNSSTLSDALHPASDAFNSSVADLGVADTGRNPGYANLLGLDASIFDADGLIANSATSATINLTTGGETYLPGVVTSVIDLHAPDLQVAKTVTDVDGGDVEPGDVLRYALTVTNGGSDNADDVVLDDRIPAGTTYSAGSLAITAGTGTGSLTDASGDDRGELSSGAVHVRLGTGATTSAGGALAVSDSATVSFDVTVDASAADGSVITNRGEISHTAATLGTPLLSISNTVSSTVVVPATPPAPTPPSPTPTPSPSPAPTPDPSPVTAPVVPDPVAPSAPVVAPSPVVTLNVAGPGVVHRGETACYTVVARSTGAATATSVRVWLPVPSGMVVSSRPGGSRLVGGTVVGAPVTLAQGARSTLPVCMRATGGARRVTLTPRVTAAHMTAVRRAAPVRVVRPVQATAPAVTG